MKPGFVIRRAAPSSPFVLARFTGPGAMDQE
jgi:hypothetical protein